MKDIPMMNYDHIEWKLVLIIQYIINIIITVLANFQYYFNYLL